MTTDERSGARILPDFVVSPPEINSARMYAGPGSGSMWAAAAAWDGLAAELGSTAGSFCATTSGLTGAVWQGPASVSMTSAAASYVGWLNAASSLAERAAAQARAAVGAFETALAATVPPRLIAANRAQLMSLVATNVLGQKAPAIAATEAGYEEMWAQDVAVMSGYLASAREVVSQLTPFSRPPAGLTGAARGLSPAALGTDIAFVMGGAGNPQPSPGYVAAIDRLYIAPMYPGYTPVSLYMPAGLWPITGLTSPSFSQSVHQGVLLLDNALTAQTTAGNNVVVVGISQSAAVATLEMRHLDALPVGARPSPDQLAFVLIGDPNNPNGGFLERLNGLHIPGLDMSLNVATPPNTPYPTTIYTVQYDPVADFPRYPIDLPADANSIMGAFYLHSYSSFTAPPLATAIRAPVSPGYTGATTYYVIPTQNLPLLDPLELIPVVGRPLVDLIQPDVRVIVDLGYGSGYANVPAPAGLFPTINPGDVCAELSLGAQQGVTAAEVDMGLLPASDLPNAYPYLAYAP